MRIKANPWLFLGAVNGLLALLAGAYRLYVMDESLTQNALYLFELGVIFHFAHAGALALVGAVLIIVRQNRQRLLDFCGAAFQIGIVLLAGALYWLAHLEPGRYVLFLFLSAVGGGCLIIGWASLTYASWPLFHSNR